MPDVSESTQLTVLMAVHNGSPFLRTAIDSVLQQTYPGFHFLIIDDASTDDTVEIVRSYRDDRVELVCLDQNVGQTAALNIGLRRATTPWIARMDADDYSAPTRFEEQMAALVADPSISCLGTHIWIFHDDPEVVEGELTTPLLHADIKRTLLRGSPMVHGSIIVDRQAILEIGGYDERYREAADYEMYDRLVSRYIAANIPKKLMGIRQHRDQGSRSVLAYDEVINICRGRLKSGDYSRHDAATIRATLSRVYIFRSRFSWRKQSVVEQLKDLARAFRVSPNTFIWNFFLVSIFDRFSVSRQSALRRVLARSAPRFLTGR